MYSVHIIVNDSKLKPVTGDGMDCYYLASGTEYAIQFVNRSRQRINCYLKIDGKQIGSFRIGAGLDGTIERFVDTDKKFMFVEVKDKSGEEDSTTGVERTASLRQRSEPGMIEVKVVPEKVIDPVHGDGFNMPVYRSIMPINTNIGITTKGSASWQKLNIASMITEDIENSIVIRVKLMAGK